jgi:hypothetical protein
MAEHLQAVVGRTLNLRQRVVVEPSLAIRTGRERDVARFG